MQNPTNPPKTKRFPALGADLDLIADLPALLADPDADSSEPTLPQAAEIVPADPLHSAQVEVSAGHATRRPGQRASCESTEWGHRRRDGAIAAVLVASVPGVGTGAGDGKAARLAVADRAGEILRLSRDGWSIRAIARQLRASPVLVQSVLDAALSERTSSNALEADRLRLLIADRLDWHRQRLLSIAEGEPQPRVSRAEAKRLQNEGRPIPCGVPTVAEQIAAHRTAVSVEDQRAKLLGANAKGAAGDLLDWLADLAQRRSAGDDTDT